MRRTAGTRDGSEDETGPGESGPPNSDRGRSLVTADIYTDTPAMRAFAQE
ncbi:hypothetical protein CU044_6222 [Streptomyces sp. L-9-10]|nr:hypothetical protein [Streptomyces sp. L-9-10]RYJ21838.1 hypothetical protein CU044_6222 [Streptomyces sp. L-9-10]